MHPVLADLIHLLGLERIEENIVRGDSRDIGSPQVFGGQVLGQALSAAQHTVEGRVAHSLHAYSLRRGDMNAPIIYEVDRARDGGSFSKRRVVAIQGDPIMDAAQIPRADVAEVCVQALAQPAALNRTFEIYTEEGAAVSDWAAFFGPLEPDPQSAAAASDQTAN